MVHYGRSPSIRELMKKLAYKSPKSAQDILAQLKEKRIIEETVLGGYRLIASPDFGPVHAQTVNVPLIGSIAAGQPILAEQNIEGFIPVSTALAKPGSIYYLLRVVGDSMDKAGIDDGDLILVRQQSDAEAGQKVVALIDDSATVKEFHKTENTVILKPSSKNKEHQPIILTEDFQIQGVVVTTIKDF